MISTAEIKPPFIEAKRFKRRPMLKVEVMVFVDWNSQIYNWDLAKSAIDETTKATRILERTSRIISKALVSVDSALRYNVNLRLYHGWTKGYEDMPSRLAVRNAVASLDFSLLSSSPSVVINQHVGYGDLLLSACNERLNSSKSIHLPGTVRVRDKTKRHEEKMVDTALASDLLTVAHRDPADWALILAEDDDLVPPIFTAEMWMQFYGGRIFLIQKRTPAKRYVNLKGLLLKGTWNV